MPALSPRDLMLKAQNLPKLQFPIQGPSLPVQDRMPKVQQFPKLQLVPALCPQDLMLKAQFQNAQLASTEPYAPPYALPHPMQELKLFSNH